MLRIRLDHDYAQLYLAHLYFDGGQFAAALEFLKKLNHQRFIEFGQRWRVVKAIEMIVCCAVELGDEALVASSMLELMESATHFDEDEMPVPTELTAVLLKCCRARPKTEELEDLHRDE